MRGTRPERALEQAVERDGVLRAGDRVLVACSGGADSVGLASLLRALRKPLALELTIGHINHGMRRSAWQDEAVVLRAGVSLNLPVRIAGLEPQVARGEASLREARYEALAAMARRCGATVVATAHTAEDQSETVLLALFRGTGTQGVAGMPARRPLEGDIDLARPLLYRSRSEVVTYVQSAGLPYAIDPTNADLTLRRNAVRQALAALRPLFPNLDQAVARAALIIDDERSGRPQAVRRNEVRRALAAEQALEGVDFEHVAAAVRALERGRSGRFAMAPGVRLTIEKGALTVHRDRKQ